MPAIDGKEINRAFLRDFGKPWYNVTKQHFLQLKVETKDAINSIGFGRYKTFEAVGFGLLDDADRISAQDEIVCRTTRARYRVIYVLREPDALKIALSNAEFL